MSATGHDLRSRTITSLFWQFLGVGGQRVVQLVSPIVLSRVLPLPEIGLFAIVLAGIGAIEALTKFMGEETTIWSQRSQDRRYLDTVFTVHVVRGIAITLLLCAVAPLLATYFEKPELAERYWLPGLFLTLAPNGFIDGLSSPARALQMKGLAFRRVALGDFLAVLFGTSLTIGLALYWRDVWAMLIGHLGTTAMRTAISYFVAPYRPRLSFDREIARELFHYGRGAAGAPFLLLMIFTAPAFVLGRLIGDAAVAVFDFAGRLAKLPEDIFLRVLAPIAIPAYAQLQNDTDQLRRAWLGAVHAYLLVGVPLTVSMAWCGNALPAVAFTAQYANIDGLFSMLALHGGIAGLTAVVGPLFWAVGRPQWDRQAQFWRCLTIYGLGVPAALWQGPLGFAVAAVVAISVALVLSLLRALPFLRLGFGDLAHAIRDGLLVGSGLGAALLGLDFVFAPEGAWRVVSAGLLGGPLLGLIALRLLRQRPRPQHPAAPPDHAPAEFDHDPTLGEPLR
ncbi:MAG: oligosaccharide flippase family protein [Planctomycetes bacterium]|nr:oligosaccharide flippase family protein [Planctomycetota bacterium]MCC7396071.1 oligosaccharide flippase family protein [Planctomycetota bacterium]